MINLEKTNWHVKTSIYSCILVSMIGLLLFSTMFYSIDIFIDCKILTKKYAFVFGSTLLLGFIIFTPKQKTIKLDLISTLIFVFIGYILLMSYLSPLTIRYLHILTILSFFILFLIFTITPRSILCEINIIIVIICFVQSCYGLGQYLGIFYNESTFRMVGSFYNPSGFAACISSGLPFTFSLLNNNCKWIKYTSLLALITIYSAVFVTASRAGMIAIIIPSIIYFRNKIYKKSLNLKHLKICLLITIPIITIGLFFLKIDSSNGRLLIWKNSINMITENNIFGGGYNYFLANYMPHQADYFTRSGFDKYAQLADNVAHPFNEYFLLTIDYGFIGLFLLISIIYLIIKSINKINCYILSLLSIGIFSLFSYPLRYPFVIIIIAYCLARLSSPNLFAIKINTKFKISGICLIGYMSYFGIKDLKFEYQWNILSDKITINTTSEILDKYAYLYENWNGNPFFLYNYSVGLKNIHKHAASITILKECSNYFNNYEVQMILAHNYEKRNDYHNAESHYIMANNMCPNRFWPLYKLFLIYQKTNQDDKAIEIAHCISDKQIKINSPIIKQMKKNANDYIINLSVVNK